MCRGPPLYFRYYRATAGEGTPAVPARAIFPGVSFLRYERRAWRAGAILIGIDEVGRGPLAGPVVAAAVCFPRRHRGIDGVKDSKLVKDAGRRRALADTIRQQALSWGLGAASVREIARHNIRRATALAMRRALARCRRRLPPELVVQLIVDGLSVPELQEPHQAVAHGDAQCHTIAAASLLAKVARDQVMQALSARRPGYGWEHNVGYGTAEHLRALRALGLTPHHRTGFCTTAIAQEELAL
jgi:ribonuclease HII